MSKELKILLQAMQESGEEIEKLKKAGVSVMKKSHHEIVTKADLRANSILKNQFMQHFPEYGWLSEESIDDVHRLSCERVWVVDPIDGTKEYASGIPEYAISVALVEKGIPILASVFNPAMGELYHAVKGKGAWLGDKKISVLRNHPDRLQLLASRSEYMRGEWDKYQQHHSVKQTGSIAYKLALLAAGRAHATFCLGPKHEWDVAAGALLVSEAGGVVANKHKEQLYFNRQHLIIDGIVATTLDVHEQVFAMIE